MSSDSDSKVSVFAQRWSNDGCLCSIPIYTKSNARGWKSIFCNLGTEDNAETFARDLWEGGYLANNAKPGLRIVKIRPQEQDYEISQADMNLKDECTVVWRLAETDDHGQETGAVEFLTIPCVKRDRLNDLDTMVQGTPFCAGVNQTGQPDRWFNKKEIYRITNQRI